MNEPENSLQLGIAAYKAGEKAKARSYLLKAVREQPDNEQAWGWLSNTAANMDERIHCLRQVVRINPANTSAAKLLQDLEGNEWIKAGPPASAPANIAATAVSPGSVGSSTPITRPATGSDTFQTIIIILLVVMVLFWLGIGFLQMALGLDPLSLDLLCYGGGNVVFSIINGFFIIPVSRRKKSALQQLYFLAIIGSGLGIFQLLFSAAYLQACAVPLYIVIGILAYANREAFVN